MSSVRQKFVVVQRSISSTCARLSHRRKLLPTLVVAIGFVPGQGDATTTQYYRFMTNTLPNGNWLFRLAQLDTDGRINYSNIRSINILDDVYSVKITPNPAPSDAALMVHWGNSQEENLQVEIFNGSFQLVKNIRDIAPSGSEQRIPLEITDLPTGKYLVRVSKGSNVQSLPLIKI